VTRPATPTASTPEPLLDLQRLVAGIRWRRRTWTGLALLCMIIGALTTVILPAGSTASSRIYVVHEDDESGSTEALVETDIALFETTKVAADALERLGDPQRPEAFLGAFSVEVVAGNVLEVTVSGRDDAEAVARGQALAEAFIADHVRRTDESAAAEARALLDRRAEAERDLEALNGRIATTASQVGGAEQATQLEALYAQRSSLTSQIQELGQRAEEASIGAPRVAAGTQIVDAPRTTSRSPLMEAAVNAAIGLVLGLGLGMGLAAVATVVQDRPVLRRDIAAHLGASVILQLPEPRRGLARLWWQRNPAKERKRVAAALVRAVRGAPGPVSLLEVGCPSTVAALATDIAEELALERPVVVVDDLPGRHVVRLDGEPEGSITLVDGAEKGADDRVSSQEHRIGVGSVGPGTAWMDLRRLGTEALLVVRAGTASAAWLHTVARQLADAAIPVIGVVLVHPDPRDRTDGTLWDGLHTALRGRAAARELAQRGDDAGVRTNGALDAVEVS
jgi:hypothetical protein